MALNAAYYPGIFFGRQIGAEDGGALGNGFGLSDDSGDGGAGSCDGAPGGPFSVFPAVYDDGGAVKAVSYVTAVNVASFAALYAAAGFAVEAGFSANVNGVETVQSFLTSTTYAGAPLPVGIAEQIMMVKLVAGVPANFTRWLVRLGP